MDSGFYSQKKEKVKNGGNVHTSFVAVHAQNVRETNENIRPCKHQTRFKSLLFSTQKPRFSLERTHKVSQKTCLVSSDLLPASKVYRLLKTSVKKHRMRTIATFGSTRRGTNAGKGALHLPNHSIFAT